MNLTIYKSNQKFISLPLEKNLYRIGRAQHCDIQLPDPHISKDHVLLIHKDGTWWIEDQSKNGICDENRQTVSGRVKLKQDLRIELNRSYQIAIEDAPKENSRTVLVSRHPTQLYAFDLNEQIAVIGRAKIIYPDDGGTTARLEIGPTGISIGSHPSNDIRLSSPLVSRFHARIESKGQTYSLVDLESTNGTSLNGLKIQRADLPERCTIEIGTTKFEFQIQKEEVGIPTFTANRLLDMAGESNAMRSIFSMIEIVAPTEAPVLIQGETGTGKELVARGIHQLSRREIHPFIALNCAALPKDLIESELFGHERGAFTGAMSTQIGAFEAANHGTLFLDEIGELDVVAQAKLLRTLETQEIRKVGSQKSQKISVRIVAATHRNLHLDVQAGRFRQDLLFRLNVVPIKIPPLRERLGDLPLLAADLLKQLNLNFSISDATLRLLSGYSFPGNIRELRNLLQRATIEYELNPEANTTGRAKQKVLQPLHFSFLANPTLTESLHEAQNQEKAEIYRILQEYQFNQSKAARALNMPLSTFNDRVRKYGIEKPRTLMRT